MNRQLPRGDRSHRRPAMGWLSRFARAVPSAGRLVSGTATALRVGHGCATVGAGVVAWPVGEAFLGGRFR